MAGEGPLSGDFNLLDIDNYAGVLTTVSAYVQSMMLPPERDLSTFSTLRSDGGRSTEQNLLGATGGAATVRFVFDPDLWEILWPLHGKGTGGRFVARMGTNAIPAPGDREFWCDKYWLSGLTLEWNTGRMPVINTTWNPARGATELGYRKL